MATTSAVRLLALRPVVHGLGKLFLFTLAQLPLIAGAPTVPYLKRSEEVHALSPSDPSLWLYLGVAAALVLSGGAFAGLTIALMGQVCSPQELQVETSKPLANAPVRSGYRMRSIYRSFRRPVKTPSEKMRPAC